jgi:PAS domain-containing protein
MGLGPKAGAGQLMQPAHCRASKPPGSNGQGALTAADLTSHQLREELSRKSEELEAAKNALAEQEQRLQLVISELRGNKTHLAEAQKLGRMGSVGSDLRTKRIFWSDEAARIYGYAPGTEPTPERILQRSHPEDVDRMRDALGQAVIGGRDVEWEHRLLMPDGSIKYQEAFREAALFGYLRHALDHAEADEKQTLAEKALQGLRTRHAEDQRRMDLAVEQKKTAKAELDTVKLIAGRDDPQFSDFERLTREKEVLGKEADRLTANSKTARAFLESRARAWDLWLRHAASYS